MLNFIFGFLSCALFLLTFYILDYLFKIRKAKKAIKKTVDGCDDINELVDKLNQLKNIFTYGGDDGNV